MKTQPVMKVHILGCSGPFPESGGATSGYLLEAGDQLLQFDFGSGVLSRLTSRMAPEELSAVFLSHWHYDHTADLLPLIYRLQALGVSLPLYAPADSGSPVRQIAASSGCFLLHDLKAGDCVTLGDVRITVGEARHPVPGIGFRAEREGRAFGYTGDTNTLPSLASFYAHCDLLLADGLFPVSAWSSEKPHLSAALAAELARDAGAGQLILTHLNPLFSPDLLLSEARGIFSRVSLAASGAVFEV